jgi:hypothetical protein
LTHERESKNKSTSLEMLGVGVTEGKPRVREQ